MSVKATIDGTVYNGVETIAVGGKSIGLSESIADGIIVTARDANGYPTALDFYGNLWPFAFSYNGQYYHDTSGWKNVVSINVKNSLTETITGVFWGLANCAEITGLDAVTAVGDNCFRDAGLINLELPEAQNIRASNTFLNMTRLKTVNLPKLNGRFTNGNNGQAFGSCTSLETVVLGGIGYTVDGTSSGAAFSGCTQAGLTITVFTTGTYVDTLVTNIRNGATNATIIVKASEDTTYGGVSYAAGDTILTSTP